MAETSRPASPAANRVGDAEIDVALNLVRRGGTEHTLRQQTFQVLLYLLEHRGRLVTKEELHQAIWKETAVGDDALVQCIVDIRKALGDDSRQPRYLKTVRKAGYLIVPPVDPPELSSSLPVGNAVRPRWHVWAFALVAVIGIGLVGAFTSAARRLWTPDADKTTHSAAALRRIVVLPFENQSGDQALAWLREGLPDMLLTDLSRAKTLSPLSRQQLAVLMTRNGLAPGAAIDLDRALEIGRRGHAAVVLVGSFAVIGQRVRVDVQLHDAETGRVLGGEQMVADKPEDILNKVDGLSARIAGRLGEPVSGRSTSSLVDVSTNDLEAYRDYVLGLEKANGFLPTEAIESFEKAVARDPQFAMAHARIGYTYALVTNQGERAKPYLERAFRLTDRLTERQRINVAAWYAIADGDYPRAIPLLRDVIAHYPDDVEAYSRLGNLLGGEEHFDEAIRVSKQGLAIDPESSALYNLLGSLYLNSGAFADAVAAQTRYVELAPEVANAYDSLGLSYHGAGDYANAIVQYRRAISLKPQFEVAVVHLANSLVALGRYREALAQYEGYIAVARFDRDRVRGRACSAMVQLLKGDAGAAWAILRKGPNDNPLNALTAEMVALARGDRAFLKQFDAGAITGSEAGRGYRSSPILTHTLRAYQALGQGHSAEAIAHFQEALRHPAIPWHVDSLQEGLADTYMSLGQLNESIAEHERLLGRNPNLARARFHLAEALARKGDAARARTEYDRFIQVWRDADPEIPELQAARAWLATHHGG